MSDVWYVSSNDIHVVCSIGCKKGAAAMMQQFAG